MFYQFKRVKYKILNKITAVPKGKVVLDERDFAQIKDYIILLEGQLHRETNRTFKSIPDELTDYFGIEKYNQMYKKMNR